MTKVYRIKLKRGRIGISKQQKAALDCLKLRKINDVNVVKDSPAMRGQIFKLQHLLEIKAETTK